jgi:hypothetical protein
MMAIFMIADPAVFTSWTLYSSVLTTLPGDLADRAAGLRRHRRGDRSLVPSTLGFAA